MTLKQISHAVYIRIGRRGLCLAILGIVFVLLGIGDLLAANDLRQLSETSPTVAPFHLALEIAPFQAWGVIFVLVGLLACISARWPPGKDAWGFGALTCLSIVWACVYYSGWLIWGATRGWVGGVLFTLVAMLLQVIAGWSEDPESYRLKTGEKRRG